MCNELLTEDELKDNKELFEAIDTDGDSAISKDELLKAYHKRATIKLESKVGSNWFNNTLD